MTLIPYRNIGERGVNFDLRASQLSPAEWSDARNVRFDNERIIKANHFGYVPAVGQFPITPYFLQQFRSPTDMYWAVMGLTKGYGILFAG